MQKRYLRLILVAMMTAHLFACSNDDGEDEPASDVATDTGIEADGTTHDDASEADADVPWDVEPSPLCNAVPELCAIPVGDEPAVHAVVNVVPDPEAMPLEVVSQPAHNNLDIEFFDGRLFFAFRTAPSHFASADTVMYVVSSEDLVSWRYEGEFALDTDLREPQFLVVDDTLLFYFAVLGDSSIEFEPQGVKLTEYIGPGEWTELEDAFDSTFIPWRMHNYDGTIYLTGYTGGENIYDADGEPVEVHWLTTEDGRSWEPVISGQPVVLRGGVSETDFVFMPDGSVVAISRNEAGDETGFGSKICTAPADDLGTWTCDSDLKKYDSPLLFRHRGDVYLIGRRNLNETGHFDLQIDDLDFQGQFFRYQFEYWNTPKRCSLWRIEPETRSVEWVLDLPSKGDTCFPEIHPLDANRYLVFNYTSPLDSDDDPNWIEGQGGDTEIYRAVITLP